MFPTKLPNKKGEQLLTLKEVADRLQCSPRTIQNQMRIGKFPLSIRIGNMHRWQPSAIDQWIKEGQNEGIGEGYDD